MRLTPAAAGLLLAAALALAGCAGGSGPGGGSSPPWTEPSPVAAPDCGEPSGGRPDRSVESLRWTVRASGDWRVRLPVPVHDGVAIADWLAHTRGSAAVPVGDRLEVAGRDSAVFLSCVARTAAGGGDCCAEDYLDATWSAGSRDAAAAQVLAGEVSLEVDYEAASNWCGGDAAGEAGGLRAGAAQVPAPFSMWCT